MNYKIFNWKGQQLMVIEADYIYFNEHGQIVFMNRSNADPLAIFPDGTLVAQSNVVNHKEKEFDFTGQKEELKKRNEHLYAEKTPGFNGGFQEDDGHWKNRVEEKEKKSRKNQSEKRMVKKLENSYTPAEKKLYENVTVEEKDTLKAAKVAMVSTGNDKLDEVQEDRAVEQIKKSEKKKGYKEIKAEVIAELGSGATTVQIAAAIMKRLNPDEAIHESVQELDEMPGEYPGKEPFKEPEFDDEWEWE